MRTPAGDRRTCKGGDEGVTDIPSRLQQPAIIGENDRRMGRPRVFCLDRLRERNDDADERDRAVRGDEDEIRLPAEPHVQMAPDDRCDDRRDAEHDAHQRQHSRRALAGVQVTHDRPRHDRNGRHPHGLNDARCNQGLDGA